ncbi:uncharacterized protein NFIA_095430 [Aspergillus fischeri NRRL 181]|uniref:Uncharacterized protein n=1 Tax=Neosartorya fischeri (strain ATCC 1020 / DSM 3700 / CBS 544.65 / FGSC A1164 / JCM 1740 / NRRL 181 / WB 181) TaxID=331117 RepID=A1DAN3_NEOFI|nr:uncharacterized protein NFIA_095430 [Aspergillus fischeri NRRL 181]EAW19923.1 hypothetical protein NFIA_095430 [Aspergillus fischeri NRRL 181]KAG2009327.1 hypothetical protein GB937_007730 [Aspergillus fischeri]
MDDRLPPDQKARLHEVADLMLEIYHTLAQMRYLDPAGIEQGPHNIDHLRPLYEKLKIDPAIIYLYSILPYVNRHVAGNEHFFHGGAFTDFRREEDVMQGRDPFYGCPVGDDYEDENGPYIRPWVTPLSQLGNHQSVIMYDARRHRIWIIDQELWSTTDPALADGPVIYSDDSDEEKEPEEKSKNRNSFESKPSRRAGDVLRDIVRWYRSLDELPGSEHCAGEWSRQDVPLKELYREYGWPDNFDGDGFQVAQARAHCAAIAKNTAEEPLRSVERFKLWEQRAEGRISAHQAELAVAKSTDEEWAARFKLWREEIWSARNNEYLTGAEQEAERLCPGGVCQRKEDLPLWELEKLRQEYRSKREKVEACQNWANESADTDPDRARYHQISLQQAKREAAIYQKAYEAALSEAERLCPGRTFQSATGNASLGRVDTVTSIRDQKASMGMMERELEALRDWALQLPDEAVQAKKLVEDEVESRERAIKFGKEMIQRDEASLAKHGNQD